MPFISPMFATPYDPENKKHDLTVGTWYAEEKYDGHRLVIEVTEQPRDLLTPGRGVTAWSRYGNERVLPRHLIDEIAAVLPNGIYDGELFVPGQKSYDVTELENSPELAYTIFDIVVFDGELLSERPYWQRRQSMWEIIENCNGLMKKVDIAQNWKIERLEQIIELRDTVYLRGGEGLILKRGDSIYQSKRTHDWLKIKKQQHATFRITGFMPSRGLKVNRGPYGMTRLVDADGIVTQVKTLNDRLLAEIAANPTSFIGRMLVCEYQDRTPDGKYQHIRWDHLLEDAR